MKCRAVYINIVHALGTDRVRVQILAAGPQRARVRLMRKAKLPRIGWRDKGATTYVRTDCLAVVL